ncbi:alpha/beta hydrolase [Streptomyces agglomeratus]|uniref:alpha/beta hydrolase fold domain-containing protein n=1 Tax=Streptomyces agglomeratus TaxID=285458 RepID=UPI001FCFFB18|nr:alpha/beta hydrolase [Streptomyces agglomeratus]
MTIEYATRYRRASRIPAEPGKPYFIEKGEGDRAHLFGDLITVYAGGEQTGRSAARARHPGTPQVRQRPRAVRRAFPFRPPVADAMTATRPSLRELIAAPHPDHARLPAAAPHQSGVRELRGVPYSDVEGSRPLELDLWLPQTNPAGPAPLVLFVHGGAWRRGRRDDMGLRTRHWAPGPFARIAAAGFAVACADYRLSAEATFPAPLDDLRAALRWLTLRSAELSIDTERTVVWGESAGGHLASLLALTHTGPPLAGAVIWYAPSDLTAARGCFTPEDSGTPEALMLGAAPATVPARAGAASPLAQVGSGAPPFLLVHGDADTMVACSHSESLAAALEETGSPVELWTVAGADHGWYGLPDAQWRGSSAAPSPSPVDSCLLAGTLLATDRLCRSSTGSAVALTRRARRPPGDAGRVRGLPRGVARPRTRRVPRAAR